MALILPRAKEFEVYHRWGGGGSTLGGIPGGGQVYWVSIPGIPTPLTALTYIDDHRSGWYAPYCNTFLLYWAVSSFQKVLLNNLNNKVVYFKS